jgi:uncharacterized protein (TIGR02246 family)
VNILKSAAVIAVGLVALAGCQKAVDTTADRNDIQAINKAWGENYNAGNAGAIADLYAEDALLMPPGAVTANGRDAIRGFLAGDTAAAKAAGLTYNVSSDADAIHISGDMAWQNGSYTVSDASGATVDTGKYLSVFQKKDGKWHLYRDTWNSDMAPAPAAAPAAETPAT